MPPPTRTINSVGDKSLNGARERSSLTGFTIQEIIQATDGKLLQGDINTNVLGISIDSRTIKPEELFIAIRGKRFNGHNFIDEAIRKGAKAILVQDDSTSYILQPTPIIKVPDAIRAFGQIARYHRKRFSIGVIAVTGSNGKTTTKEMIGSILQERYNVLKSIGTQNNHIGIPQTLLSLKPQHRFCVLEMGTNHFGEIKNLSNIAEPDIAVITNIGLSHLEFLGDIKGVFKAKYELLENLGHNSIAVLNGDDEMLSEIKEQKNRYKVITFGFNPKCNFVASNLSHRKGRLKFILNHKDSIELRTTADVNVYNALASIATSSIFKVNLEIIKDALSNFVFPLGRMQIRQIKGLKIIDDSYNSNPVSMSIAIRSLCKQNSSGRKILVAGDMLELGSKSCYFHYDIGRLVAGSKIDLLITVGELSKSICQGALDGGMKEKDVLSCNSNQEAVEELLNSTNPGDVILVKGSRAMKMEEIVNAFYVQHR